MFGRKKGGAGSEAWPHESAFAEPPEIDELIDQIVRSDFGDYMFLYNLPMLPQMAVLRGGDEVVRIATLGCVLRRLADLHGVPDDQWSVVGVRYEIPPERQFQIYQRLIGELRLTSLALTEPQILRLMTVRERMLKGYYWRGLDCGPMIALVEAHARRIGVSPEFEQEIRRLMAHWTGGNADHRRWRLRALAVLRERPPLLLEPGDAWSDRALEQVSASEHQEAWHELLNHCGTAEAASPNKKWLKTAADLLEPIGESAFESAVLDWFPLVDQPRTLPHPNQYRARQPGSERMLPDTHAVILKGLCWIAGTLDSADLARALGALAFSCYKKVPGIGPRATKVGNAAINALSTMSGEAPLGQIALLRVKVKFGSAQKIIEKALDTAAKRAGVTREDLEEMAVPGYGLTGVGVRREEMSDFAAELRIVDGNSTNLVFIKRDGKEQKSVPAAIKDEYAADLKELKAAAKDIQKMLPAQRDRIDGLFCSGRSWPVAVWRERYIDHPLVGTVARRIIWSIDSGKRAQAACWLDESDGFVASDGSPVAIEGDATVSLWHPIDAPLDEVQAWRRFFEDRRIRQPFKQAHREVYLLTDAERNTGTYSNRFAAHIVRQHQFNALCLARAWKNKLRLMVDAEYPPAHRLLAHFGLRAEFWVEGVGEEYGEHTNDTGVYHHLATDQVRFYAIDAVQVRAHAGGGGYTEHRWDGVAPGEPLPLEQIPPLVLSEVMRDVDLFVGVASIGNNPVWHDGGMEGHHHDYWYDYSFGALSGTAASRRDLLERLVPKLKIASACTLTDRFLVVLGTKRTYKIHLGSGNILMEPNDQYLCIVPNQTDTKSAANVFLPFEGDRTLSVILSKAFLLAADDTITDKTILSQIGG